MKRLAVIIFVIFCLALPLIFINKIILSGIALFTKSKIYYSSSHGIFPSDTIINGLSLSVKDKNLTIRAEKALINTYLSESIRKAKFICKITLDKVRFSSLDKTENKDSDDGLLSIPFDPQWEYDSVYFTLVYDGKSIHIAELNAISDNIVISSDIKYLIRSETIESSLRMYVSPEASETALGDLKSLFMTKTENGWFTLNTSFSGNIKNMNFSIKSDLFEMNIRGE